MTGKRIEHPPLPPADQRAGLGLDDVYAREEFEALKKGLEPMAMEDKWAIAYDAPWLYFRRSWTGCCVFAIRLEETGDASGASGASGTAGARIAESWASRNEDEYRSESLDDDRATLRFLIDAFLLNKPARLPQPPSSVGDQKKQVYQHHVFGRTDAPPEE